MSTYNTTQQAQAILAQLRTDLTPLGITTITRGRLMRLPPPPAAVLVLLGSRLQQLALKMDEAQYNWLLIIMRAFAEDEERAEQLDTWADAAMQSILTVTCANPNMSRGAGQGPDRIDDESLAERLQDLGRNIDVTAIRFHTLRTIELPCA
jgi:flagellar biosynthesis component FlhA